MKGTGVAFGGITFLNALFTGTGAAAGVDLPVRASVDLTPAPATRVELHGRPAPAYVAATVEAACARWVPGDRYWARARIESQVPPAVGLKSSSAVGGAIIGAVAAALGRTTTPEEVARLAAHVARSSGQSATGAFDDALASVRPGIHVTDNPHLRLLRSDLPDPEWRVALLIPPGRHAPSPSVSERFRRRGPEAARAETDARAGRPLEAMRRNSELVESVLGYDLHAIRSHAEAHGALAVGVSGLGPAVAAILPRGVAWASGFARDVGRVVETRFLPPIAEAEETP